MCAIISSLKNNKKASILSVITLDFLVNPSVKWQKSFARTLVLFGGDFEYSMSPSLDSITVLDRLLEAEIEVELELSDKPGELGLSAISGTCSCSTK